MNVNYRHRQYQNRLKVIRQNNGYSQKHVARLLGFRSPSLLSDWEKGKSMPNGVGLIKLCIILNRTPQELYPGFWKTLEQQLTTI